MAPPPYVDEESLHSSHLTLAVPGRRVLRISALPLLSFLHIFPFSPPHHVVRPSNRWTKSDKFVASVLWFSRLLPPRILDLFDIVLTYALPSFHG